MKKVSICLFFTLVCSIIFSQEWEIKEKNISVNNFPMYSYEITNAPEEYSEYINSAVYYCYDKDADIISTNFMCSKKDTVLNLLNTNKFYLRQLGNKKLVYIPEIPVNMKTKISKEQLKFMWNMFEENYIAFSEMKEKGLSKRKFFKIKTYNDLQKFMNKYVDDCHMSICINDYKFYRQRSHDEGCVKSIDPENTYYEKETSNAYYVRTCNCNSQEYYDNFPLILYKAIDKQYLVIDARSNRGGDNTPVAGLQSNLSHLGFKGTVVVLQDNYSFSSGEMWIIFGQPGSPYKCILVGTHSGGMQRFGNNMPYQNAELGIIMYLCQTEFHQILPKNYLGEGKGYEPDIWATTPQMKQTLEDMGIDTGDIIFQ